MKRTPAQKQKEPEGLFDIVLGGGDASAVGGLAQIGGARVVIRGMADQIHVLTSIGKEDLTGWIAEGIRLCTLAGG